MNKSMWQHVLLISTLLSALFFMSIFTGNQPHARAGQEKMIFKQVVGTCEDCETAPDQVMKRLLGVENTYLTTDGDLIVWYDDELTQSVWLERSLRSAGYQPKNVLR
ncbi:hypothetical protein G4V62_03120 [Bacillaceae bacterium SIJ1]|uniref:hypothetical protein n=1 Tax=Litoribacterium kuwaitense TaxID=1398745 RepID=UPI0013EC905A|nr:hypothetical protein [Litoribacterium kuwaitense]NGP43989.1 hypothetical protein [Litoribacterium kuwaitense]